MFRLAGNEDDPGAAVRPSYSIYELWCFFALQSTLERSLPGWKWSFTQLDRLLDITGRGEHAKAVATLAGYRLTLEFNPTFRSLYAHKRARRYSLSGERRPDFVLSLEGNGTSDWVVLDAKYRAGRRNLQNAMESLHIYRDSLVDEERDGRPKAAILLAPRACEDVPLWSDPAWQEKWGVGLIQLAPGVQDRRVAAWALSMLGIAEKMGDDGAPRREGANTRSDDPST